MIIEMAHSYDTLGHGFTAWC